MSSNQQSEPKSPGPAPTESKMPVTKSTTSPTNPQQTVAKDQTPTTVLPPQRVMLPTAFFIPNPDGSTAVAQLVPSTQAGGSEAIQNFFINSIITKNAGGGSQDVVNVLTTPFLNKSAVRIITPSAPAGAKISITPAVAPVVTKTVTAPAITTVKSAPAQTDERPVAAPIAIQPAVAAPSAAPQAIIGQVGSTMMQLQFKKIQPAETAKAKTIPKLLKPTKKHLAEQKAKKQSATESPEDCANEFPDLIKFKGPSTDPPTLETTAPEPAETISYEDLLCNEEMGKKSDDGQGSSSKSPEPMDEDKKDDDEDSEPDGAEEEKSKTFKPPARSYKRPSILGARKRVRPEPSTQAMLKETLRAELLKLHEEGEKEAATKKKAKRQPKEKKGGPKLARKIDESLIRPAIEDFDPASLLEWKDGVGVLPGSNLKFRVNELGLMELFEESEGSEEELSVAELLNKCDNIAVINKSKPDSDGESVPKKRARKEKVSSCDTPVRCCENCFCYGLATEFVKQRFCTKTCEEKFERKLAAQAKKNSEAGVDRRGMQSEKPVQLEKLDPSCWASEEGTSEAPLPAPESPDPDVAMADADSTPACSKPNSPEPRSSATPTSDAGDDDSKDEGYPNDMPWINFNSDRTPNFLWPKYLEFTKTRAAPAKLFEEGGFPDKLNGFRAGMKLEGIDPKMPSQFVVATVASTKGFRVKMHIDGQPDTNDFWVNADCKDIFPAGYCEKIGRKLIPPKTFAKKFSWAYYLKVTNASLAPKGLFAHRQLSKTAVGPSGFRIGMKLEAVDKTNHDLVCVASVADIVGGRILIHFDSWDDSYDYWADPTSPFIHPIGWCQTNNIELIPPKGHRDFNWDTYLKDTKSQGVPVRAFKPRPCPAFKRGMKLECVDPRFPQLIRVGSVLEVRSHRLHIGFDNWPLETSTWMDADSPDIHPMGWCNKTGHPLGPPPVPGVEYQCYTQGCRALLKNSHFVLPHMNSCPLSAANLAKARSIKLNKFKVEPEPEPVAPVKIEEPEEEENGASEEEEEYVPQVRRPRKAPVERPLGNIRSDVHDSVFRASVGPSIKNLPVTVATHAKLVNWGNIEGYFDTRVEGVKKWSANDVCAFCDTVLGKADKSKVFLTENINGNAFLMLNQSDLVELLGFKIGQAVKIYNSILLLKEGK